jgi:hypothetical protein
VFPLTRNELLRVPFWAVWEFVNIANKRLIIEPRCPTFILWALVSHMTP